MKYGKAGYGLHLGSYIDRVNRTLGILDRQAFSIRLWQKNPSLWRQGPDGDKIIINRLGWLNVTDTMVGWCDEILRFAEEVKDAGFKHAVLMGMGGSSLSPEVSRLTFGVRQNYPDLTVLDSIVPESIRAVDRKIDPASTLFIVSTKSGTTVETLSAYYYYLDRVRAAKGEQAGSNFIAITDPGTSLEKEARERNFRRVFLNFADIGGRYSALSYFGLVPAAIIGADIGRLLDRASCMVESCSPKTPVPDNPGMALGTAMAELAMMGRDKLTLILSPEIRSFGCWIEQLVAESTGKNGTGILPVEGEPLAGPERYGDDRLFVYLKLESHGHTDLDAKVNALERAGQPLVRIRLDDVYDLGSEYFRWEVATATASALLGVNAFDEPNVRESKDNTNALLEEFKAKHKLPQEKPILDEDGIQLYCDEKMKAVLDVIRASTSGADNSLRSYLAAHLNQHQPGNYFALMVFADTSPEADRIFERIRGELRDAYKAATTLGHGPRFLHSTGQFYKGGPNNGIFIQFTADDKKDIPIPGETYSFSVLKQAQAMGDAIALRSKGRPLIRLNLGTDPSAGLKRVLDMIRDTTSWRG